MKAVILAEYLKKYSAIAERFTGKNITLPILGNIHIECTGQKMLVTATNLEIACVLNLPAKILKEGVVTVPARAFASYLQTIQSNGKISLEEKNGVLHIEADSMRSKVLTIPPKDFPLIPRIKKGIALNIPIGEFKKTLQYVATAASTSHIKPELNGVFISYHSQDNTCTCAATDTFRLAERKIFLSKGNHEDFSFILPLKSVQEIIHFQTDEKDAELMQSDAQVKFSFGDHEMVSNVTAGTFPNYEGIIPKNFGTRIRMQRAGFIDAIRSASFFSSKLQDVHLKAESSDALELSAKNSEVGETAISLAAKIQGKPAHVSFNYKFLLDGAQGIDGNEIILSLNNESTPALLQSADDSHALYLIMPIKNI